MAKITDLLIPVSYLNTALSGANDSDGRLTDAITRASFFVSSFGSQFLPFDAYTEGNVGNSSSSSASSASGDAYDDDDIGDEAPTRYTINCPQIIAHITLQIAIAMYKLSIDEIRRNGEERSFWQDQLNEFKEQLKTMDVDPELYSKTISLDSNGCMLIARNQAILTNNAYVTSATTNIWNILEHWQIRKGGIYSTEQVDGWYFDASNYSTTMEGTLYYYRSYRRDNKDYMETYSPDRTLNLRTYGFTDRDYA